MGGDGKRVLVTGGAGFIGSHTVVALLEAGYRVGVLDNLSSGKKHNLPDSPSLEFHEADILDTAVVLKLVGKYDSVVHLAARVSVPRSLKEPTLTNAVNVEGTLNLLMAAKDTGIKRFVYASSSSVYGDSPTLPKVETMPPNPVSPYAVSKLAGEQYCRVFTKAFGLETVSLRYFNVFGPRQTPGPYSGVVPAFVTSCLKGEPPVIFGDGGQTRDFTFVKDAVQANLLALEKDVPQGAVFNVASSRRTSINELAELAIRLTGRTKITPLHSDAREGDVRHSLADITTITKILGYKPRYSLEEGLTAVIDWMKSTSS